MPEAIEVRKVPLHSVSDAGELAKLIDDGVFEADRVVAVIGKTEATAASTTTRASSRTGPSVRSSPPRAAEARTRWPGCPSSGPAVPTV